MGGFCESVNRNRLNADQIVENINKLFKGMLIRLYDIQEIQEKVCSLIQLSQVIDIENLKTFLIDKIYNREYGLTCLCLVDEAILEVRTNYYDYTLPLLSLLFLANSDRDNFINAFKNVNLAKINKNVGNDINNVTNTVQQNTFPDGLRINNNDSGVVHQETNSNLIEKEELRNMINYYVNFVTLLPAKLIGKYNEGIKMKDNYFTILKDAFNENIQNRFIEETLFRNFNNEKKINLEDFLFENYLILKDDNGIRKGLVNNYINNLSPSEIDRII